MKDKKKLIILVIAVIVLVLIISFIVGKSFGFFKYIKKGENVNIITINGIEVDILNDENDALNLAHAYPISDSEGLSLTPFEFSITNTASRSINYSIIVEIDEEKMASCTLEDGTACPELSTDYIKYTYKKNDGTYIEPRNLGGDNNIIASDIIEGTETVTSSIIIWIDSNAGNEIMNHYFYGKLLIVGTKLENTVSEGVTAINIPNGLEQNLLNLEIAGNTENDVNLGQDGSIDLVVSGKNLANFTELTNYNFSNIFVNIQNNEITINGGNTQQSNFWPTLKITGEFRMGNGWQNKGDMWIDDEIALNKGPYVITINHIGGDVTRFDSNGEVSSSPTKYIALIAYSKDNTFGNDLGFFEYKSRTVKKNFDTNITFFSIYFPGDVELFENYKFRVQIEYGDTATSFEPYKEMRYTINLIDIDGNTINGLSSSDKLIKKDNSWVISKDDGTVITLCDASQEVLNNVSIYDGVSNIWIDETISPTNIKAEYISKVILH